MKYLMVGLMLFLATASMWAGTWRDDFNDGDFNGWAMAKGIWKGKLMLNEGNWRVEGGMIIGGEEVANNTWHALSVSEGQSWSDYTAEVSVNIPKPLPRWANVVLYISPETGRRSSSLTIQEKGGSIFAEGRIYTHPATDIHIAPKPFKMEPDRWYRLKIKVEEKINDEEGILQCFIDDQPIVQFQGYRKGTPGFSTYQCVAMFDDFTVTGPGIPTGGPGSKAVSPRDKLVATWARLRVKHAR